MTFNEWVNAKYDENKKYTESIERQKNTKKALKKMIDNARENNVSDEQILKFAAVVAKSDPKKILLDKEPKEDNIHYMDNDLAAAVVLYYVARIIDESKLVNQFNYDREIELDASPHKFKELIPGDSFDPLKLKTPNPDIYLDELFSEEMYEKVVYYIKNIKYAQDNDLEIIIATYAEDLLRLVELAKNNELIGDFEKKRKELGNEITKVEHLIYQERIYRKIQTLTDEAVIELYQKKISKDGTSVDAKEARFAVENLLIDKEFLDKKRGKQENKKEETTLTEEEKKLIDTADRLIYYNRIQQDLEKFRESEEFKKLIDFDKSEKNINRKLAIQDSKEASLKLENYEQYSKSNSNIIDQSIISGLKKAADEKLSKVKELSEDYFKELNETLDPCIENIGKIASDEDMDTFFSRQNEGLSIESASDLKIHLDVFDKYIDNQKEKLSFEDLDSKFEDAFGISIYDSNQTPKSKEVLYNDIMLEKFKAKKDESETDIITDLDAVSFEIMSDEEFTEVVKTKTGKK